MTHHNYDLIEKVIHHIDNHYQDQPSLDDLAQVVGLSTSHFHRIFQSWAGVTPKQFLKYITAQNAKERLLKSQNVLDTALDLGLSGPSRLHDLCISIDGASPGEIKSQGEGLIFEWGCTPSPFGYCNIAWTQRGICHLEFVTNKSDEAVPIRLLQSWPKGHFQRIDKKAKTIAKKIFHQNKEAQNPLQIWVKGTAFQLRVWQALLCIPEGNLCTYGSLAQAIGKPRAARAVGTACGANPIGYLIPCHRVIRETGIVDGYRWGSTRKKIIIAREANINT